ncbi:LAETG motif-containing sortase-dependent surface protein [Streptomyces halobius]|uniref:LPXTG-motif cell wall-anchored protein n=1 Tax=Streptomyces halobius TaxID=2879846 RepID=A0ABY4M6K6_9ACTN|nr:LAETG motif-containing sortase-dependent surface protein [Streptomyces halobius]UQA93395.1 hypothetical protein K9S39_17450 [Streptomyces halobius]
MTARRPLLTATVAGTVLFALWFVPSANAFVEADRPGRPDSGTEGSGSRPAATDAAGPGDTGTGTSTDGGTPRRLLADTGSPNTTPYMIGGAACLALGAGLVAFSVRRTRDETG